MLADTYGRDPDSLLPLFGPKYEAALSSNELTMVDEVLTSLGYLKPHPNIGSRTGEPRSPAFPLSSSRQEPDTAAATNNDTTLVDGESTKTSAAPPSSVPMPRPGFPVWDYSAEFGGELYTVEWESKLLLQISDASRKFVRNHLQKVAIKGVITVSAKGCVLAGVDECKIFQNETSSLLIPHCFVTFCFFVHELVHDVVCTHARMFAADGCSRGCQ
jgi:hypothetical protein